MLLARNLWVAVEHIQDNDLERHQQVNSALQNVLGGAIEVRRDVYECDSLPRDSFQEGRRRVAQEALDDPNNGKSFWQSAVSGEGTSG